MNRQTENKILMVVRDSRWRSLLMHHGTGGQAAYYLQSRGIKAAAYLAEDRKLVETQAQVADRLNRLGRLQILNRDHLPNFIFGPDDVIVVVGQDGLVANTLKYTDGQPVIGINPDPGIYEGILLPFAPQEIDALLPAVFARRRPLKFVTMAEALLNDGRTLRAVNDLFIGPKTHTSARYEIQSGEAVEDQSSSGVIVSTGLGSTGWFRSVLTGATGIVESYGYGRARIAQTAVPMATKRGRGQLSDHPIHVQRTAILSAGSIDEGSIYPSFSTEPDIPKFDGSFPWDARHLCFTVREPFPTRRTGASIVYGQVDQDTPLVITSQMPENGVIFSDGIEADCLEFNSGDVATIGLSKRVGKLVV